MKSHSKNARNIVIQYNNGDTVLKMNRAKYPDTAIMRCLGYLQTDEYGASYAIVYDVERGIDHAVFTRTPNKIEVLYKRKVVSHERP